MTTWRFVGDVPLWLGLVLSLVVAVLSWRYYSRESFGLPNWLKWFLPLLRSLAFFLGIMILTGPVLHHRKTIGELGKVKVYIDGSNSMSLHDRHMSLGRKLLIAEQLGWLSEGSFNPALLTVSVELKSVRHRFESLLSSMATTEASLSTVDINELLAQLRGLHSRIPKDVESRFETTLISPLESFSAETDAQSRTISLKKVIATCQGLEDDLSKEFEASFLASNANSDNFQSAIAMFDETPRTRRAELGLSGSSAHVIDQLREKHDVEVFRLTGKDVISDQLIKPREDTVDSSAASTKRSSVTDLSSGIVASQKGLTTSGDAEDQSMQVQTAIVILSDGQHNSGPSPLQTARVLGQQGVKYYCVSLGASQQAVDMAVVDVQYPEVVFQKDRVRGVMTIRDRMQPGRPIIAQVTHGEQVLWQQQLLSNNVDGRKIEFEFAIDELVKQLGTGFDSDIQQHMLPLKLQASIVPLADEVETKNNSLSFRLAAIIQGYKVLILDGRSRWETRYLRNVFERDEQWQVNTVIAGGTTDDATLPRGDNANQFPGSRDALFEYDMIIFGEISPVLFQDHEYTWLREFVELRGGGIVFIDGHRGTLRQLNEQSLASLLPVEWRTDQIDTKPKAFQLTDKGAGESSFKLATDDQKNRRLWTELPAPHAMVSVDALPGSEVLLEVDVAGYQRPAIVTRAYGAGRVLYLAFDETWRWRYKVADEWHQRIWNQLAKFVMPQPFAVSDEYVSLDTGAPSYEFGESVPVRLRLMGLDGKPALNATADALISKGGQVVSTVNLIADADIPGMYHGRSAALAEGDYEVSVRASGYSDAVLKARTQFEILSPESGELVETSADEALLQQMAMASGGVSLREEEISKLPELLSPLSHGHVVESDTLIWQSYWWFAAIVLLLTTEWILRKRSGLL